MLGCRWCYGLEQELASAMHKQLGYGICAGIGAVLAVPRRSSKGFLILLLKWLILLIFAVYGIW